MAPTYSATGRQLLVRVPALTPGLTPGPASAESVQPLTQQDPPIYRALLRTWADRGRALPGHDPEWAGLATALQDVVNGISEPRGPAGDGR
ncbi:hypothetical protein AB0F77_06930 [Streptomyces sp. NPDC026672]|uniref:hypothetical protein n=1 Tax=unclassified Streptomyces TaxID=2593676 RepID=UPI00340219DD